MSAWEKWGHKRSGIAEQLNSRGASDIYFHGNPQEGCWRYGTGENNPTCSTLSYCFCLKNEEKKNRNYLIV